MQILGFAGKARSGKDSAANVTLKHGFERFAFADALKKAAAEMFDLPVEHFYASSLKDTVVEYWNMTPREMMLKLGTDAAHPIFGKDVWVRRLHLDVMKSKVKRISITDVRFEHEADYVRNNGGHIVHIERDNTPTVSGSGHVAEAGIERKRGDFILVNDGTLIDLEFSMLQILGDLEFSVEGVR